MSLLTPATRAAVRSRIAAVVDAVDPNPVATDPRAATTRLAEVMPAFTVAEFWLLLGTVRGHLPAPAHVRRVRRAYELDGADGALAQVLAGLPRDVRVAPVEIVTDRALVDVTGLLPGEDGTEGRGAGRQLIRAWSTVPGVLPVTWTSSRRSLRGLGAAEYEALGIRRGFIDDATLLVPHRSRFVLLGTVDLPRAAERLIALGQYSLNETGSVGYGITPLIEPQAYPRQRDSPHRFSWHVAAQRSFTRLAALGDDVEQQYRGWALMLSAIGLTGPEVTTFPLPNVTGAIDSGATQDLSFVQWASLARDIGAVLGVR
jgi:hypothetical protein